MGRLAESERAHAAALELLAHMVASLCDRAKAPAHERDAVIDQFVELGLDDDEVLDKIAGAE